MRLLFILLLLPVLAGAQKINKCNYKIADTVIVYSNGWYISYIHKGKRKVDRVFKEKMKCNIDIQIARVVEIREDELLTHK